MIRSISRPTPQNSKPPCIGMLISLSHNKRTIPKSQRLHLDGRCGRFLLDNSEETVKVFLSLGTNSVPHSGQAFSERECNGYLHSRHIASSGIISSFANLVWWFIIWVVRTSDYSPHTTYLSETTQASVMQCIFARRYSIGISLPN